jgi:hypothetical protein
MTMKYWTIEEYDTLRRIANCSDPIKTQMHLLPGRSMTSAVKAMRRLGLEKNTKDAGGHCEAILKLLAKRSMLSSELSEKLGLSRVSVDERLKKLHKEGKIHITDRIITGACNRARLWKLGPGVDMPPVSKKRKSVSKKKIRAQAVEPEKKLTPVKVRRDEFTSFFFGSMEAA